MNEILKGLNDKQYEAVINTKGPCLVIAGAGSGKTKVLTHKIAYIMGEQKALPWNILAITFTNKAANEMKERIEGLVGDAGKDMWIGTFHSICVRILGQKWALSAPWPIWWGMRKFPPSAPHLKALICRPFLAACAPQAAPMW